MKDGFGGGEGIQMFGIGMAVVVVMEREWIGLFALRYRWFKLIIEKKKEKKKAVTSSHAHLLVFLDPGVLVADGRRRVGVSTWGHPPMSWGRGGQPIKEEEGI